MRRRIQENYSSMFCVIPSEIVEDMKLKSGDKLDFSIEGDHIKVMPIHQSSKINVQAYTPEPIKAEGCR
jgi:bifunctional DNA-binding transcriptional regulator/antitoxin component of YhaV-PrlF toxin-antitoxin module